MGLSTGESVDGNTHYVCAVGASCFVGVILAAVQNSQPILELNREIPTILSPGSKQVGCVNALIAV